MWGSKKRKTKLQEIPFWLFFFFFFPVQNFKITPSKNNTHTQKNEYWESRNVFSVMKFDGQVGKKTKGRGKNDFLKRVWSEIWKEGKFDIDSQGKRRKGRKGYNKECLEGREAINGRGREKEWVRIGLKSEEWKVWREKSINN